MTPIKNSLYRVTSGSFSNAIVRYHFTNSSGYADCRFAEDFGPYRRGEIVVFKLDQLTCLAKDDG
jgi:hypothetical protein